MLISCSYQLWTINFCTANSASYLTLGSEWASKPITMVFPPSCSRTLENGKGEQVTIREATNNRQKWSMLAKKNNFACFDRKILFVAKWVMYDCHEIILHESKWSCEILTVFRADNASHILLGQSKRRSTRVDPCSSPANWSKSWEFRNFSRLACKHFLSRTFLTDAPVTTRGDRSGFQSHIHHKS